MTKSAFTFGCLVAACTTVNAAVFLFDFENGERISGGSVYGSPGGFPALVRDGFVVDVQDGGGGASAHWHEVADSSDVSYKIPASSTGVLWRDSISGQDPLFFAPATPTFVFTLNSLDLAASSADSSMTYAVRLSAFRNGNSLGSVELPAVAGNPEYVNYSGAALGVLDGLTMDRLEFIGLSSSSLAYYQLDNVSLQTTAVPEPSVMAWSTVSGISLLGFALHRRRMNRDRAKA